MIDPKLKPHQVLAVAIAAEVDAAAFYTRLQERVRNVILLQKLKFLAFEEEKHRQILERLFAERFAGLDRSVPEGASKPRLVGRLEENPAVVALFRAALEAEIASERFYNDAAQTLEDEAGRRILGYLARVERSHQSVILSEIDLLDRFPDYYNVEDFHIAGDLFHIGP